MKAVQRLIMKFKALDIRKCKLKLLLDIIGRLLEFLVALFLMKQLPLTALRTIGFITLYRKLIPDTPFFIPFQNNMPRHIFTKVIYR